MDVERDEGWICDRFAAAGDIEGLGCNDVVCVCAETFSVGFGDGAQFDGEPFRTKVKVIQVCCSTKRLGEMRYIKRG